MKNNSYPEQSQFIEWCRTINHLSNQSISMINMAVISFWKYYKANSINEPIISNVTASDVEEYLSILESKENLQIRTINKYLSYLKKYFKFLASYKYIDSYPLFTLNGHQFNRKITIFTNWASEIPNLLDKNVQPDTIKLLVLISLGYDTNELLSIRWKQITERINNKILKSFLRENLIFDKTLNPYIFQTRKGEPVKTIEAIMHRVRKDQKILNMPLSPIKLRQSYILSCVSDDTKSDAELKKTLNIGDKTLSYYKYCVNYYNLKDYSFA